MVHTTTPPAFRDILQHNATLLFSSLPLDGICLPRGVLLVVVDVPDKQLQSTLSLLFHIEFYALTASCPATDVSES